MKSKEYLEYKVNFELVDSLEKAERKEGYLDYHQIGKSIYAISIDPKSQRKDLAKLIIPDFIPKFEELFNAHLSSSREPFKKLTIDSSFETYHSEN
jgi:hypothetical protein